MGKKHSYAFVKESFVKENYELLSTKYKNSHTKLKYRCTKGHEHSITFADWKHGGYRCPYCAGNRKYTIEYVKESFELEGYVLLSKKYINVKTKLHCVCKNGHMWQVNFSDWRNGIRCYQCNGTIPPTYKQVKKSFEDVGYTLLSKEYINNNTKLDYVCSNNHTHSIMWRNWQRGDRCPYCAGQGKPTIEYIIKEFKKELYILLSKEYFNNKTKLYYICPVGHKHYITWSAWKNGNRCFYCSDSVPPTLQFIKESFVNEGYELLSKEYINNCIKLDYVCNIGHKHSITWANWYTGYRCPECANIKHAASFIGSNHPNWKGGISSEPYCEIWKDKEYKQSIKERDGHRCLNPDCWYKDKMLVIHHIDYNKKNCHFNNLITVCRSCNSRANIDRDWHKAWYQAILKQRYNYTY